MLYNYHDTIIYYNKNGCGPPIIMLHGWGQSSETFTRIVSALENDYQIYTLDLAGFGKSSEPSFAWDIYEYANMLNCFIKDKQICNPIIIGHSFGGRIAIKYTSKYEVNKLILIDSAGIRKRSIIKRIKITLFKIKKFLYQKKPIKLQMLYEKSGSSDYRSASIMMRKILNKAVNEDLQKEMRKINCSTLLMWGRKDKVTPYHDCLKMKRLIKNAGIVEFRNSGHFPYLEEERAFIIIIKNYLKGE